MLPTLILLTALLLAASLLPFVPSPFWVFRVCEFPRLQKLVLSGLVAAGWGAAWRWHPAVAGGVAAAGLGLTLANAAWLAWLVWPFTPWAAKQVLDVARPAPGARLSLLIANVYQYNRRAEGLLAHVRRHRPDVVYMAETDAWWAAAVAPLHADYPHRVEKPLGNTYGMLVFSRLPLEDPQVAELVEAGVPSVHAWVRLPNGARARLHCVHPAPPSPTENLTSAPRDRELLLVAKKSAAENDTHPVIVTGDLNDVAWSHSTRLFQNISGLLDPRRGRGMFNTFHAKLPFLRFPLDHLFCSRHFGLVRLARLAGYGSDHFPMLIELALDARAEAAQVEPAPDAHDHAEAAEKIGAPATPDPVP